MNFTLQFTWLLLTSSVGCLSIYCGSSELPLATLRYVTSESLLNHDNNLISLLRMMKSGVAGLIQHYEDNCSLWSYETFLRIKSFVLEFPKTAQLLMTAQCYICLSDFVKELYSIDGSNVIKDFDEGLFGVYPNPIISGQSINKLKFLSFAEEFDPDAYIYSIGLFTFEDLIKADDNLPQDQAEIVMLLFSYLYRAFKAKSKSLDSFEAQDMKQIIRLICGYAERIYVRNALAFFFIFSSFEILGAGLVGWNFFLDAYSDISPLTSELSSDQTSTFYFLQRSLLLSDQYPYREEHFAVQREISKMKLGNRSLIRYATILTKLSNTPFETCRFFLGMKNIKKLQLSRELLRYGSVRVCLTRDESILYARRWHYSPIEDYFAFDSQGDEESIMKMANYFLNNHAIPPVAINSEPTKTILERSILLLIDRVNEVDGEIVTIRSMKPNNDKKISFPISIFYDDLHKARMLTLIKLIVLMNLHFDSSLSLEEDTLQEILHALHVDDDFQEEEFKVLEVLVWIFNVQPKYPKDVAKLARQINWDSDI